MRQYQKKQCMDAIDLLEEAHMEIVKHVEKGRIREALALLEQCQQGAIGIGSLIEAAGEEGAEAIHCLEEYCELIYRFHEKLFSTTAPGSAHQMPKKLRKPLMRTANCLRYEIPTQIEAVFLPYKASMWDSLESVWEAANRDPDCKAIVLPIPYYDRKADGSLGEAHCEADLFPPQVPIEPYDAYDFAARHPDIIFIHNPYDEENYVTSVHPFFFSKNLKQYTDKLVYIPYFVQEEIDPSNQAAVDKMEHFCILPGVVNSDYVFVQSEAMRQIYVDVLVKYTSEELRTHWQGRILGLGSPKVDRVCSLRREDYELPQDWSKLILREDGSRKKVIFYNTSIGGILVKEEAMLDKMEQVFRIFRENAGDVTLLWRPHPLMETTIAAMRPQLAERYRKLVEEYRSQGWGIYDDSADMYRAIAVSDGYYGDKSSVVYLYQHTGKPVMLQNVN